MEILQQFAAAALVLALLGGTLFVLQRQGRATFGGLRTSRIAGEKRLEVVERLTLTAQHSLHLVKLDGRTLLLGLYPNGCSLLTSVGEEGKK